MLKYEAEVRRQPKELSRIISNPHQCVLETNRPIRLFGIGTSLHACRVAEFWFRQLGGEAIDVGAEEAHYPAIHGHFDPSTQVVVVSHRGTKRYPNAILERARAAGCQTFVVTADSEIAPEADTVLRTCSPDLASTHTVSYTTALAVLAQLVINSLGESASDFERTLKSVPDETQNSLDKDIPEEIPTMLARAERVLVTGFGIDAVTADEAALKLKEGTYKWADSLSIEFALHGPPAAYQEGLVVLPIRPDIDDGGRTDCLCSLLSELNVRYSSVGTDNSHLRFSSSATLTRPFTSIIPLQRLVGLVAPQVGANPDTIRTDVSPWSGAMKNIPL